MSKYGKDHRFTVYYAYHYIGNGIVIKDNELSTAYEWGLDSKPHMCYYGLTFNDVIEVVQNAPDEYKNNYCLRRVNNLKARKDLMEILGLEFVNGFGYLKKP
jgi:hypothetical protein